MPLSKDHEDRFQAQSLRIDRLFDDFGSLKLLMEKNNTSLEEFIDLAKGFKFGLKILGYIEKGAVWITKVVVACGSVWAVWKFAVREAIISLTK